MEYKKDYLEREIEKITDFLKKLLNESIEEGSSLEEIDESFKGRFGFYFFNIENDKLSVLLEKEDVLVLKKVLDFINGLKLKGDLNKEKRLLLIKIIDDKQGIFSFERML